ncbi:TPA: hypothetical protein DEF17_09510 [bacterium]|nr:hypothetical protein [bacterium]
MNTVVVIPSKNEEKRIQTTIEEIFTVFQNRGLERPTILLTDDSTDNTRVIARKVGANVINGGGKGLGFAMYLGLKAALEFQPDIIVAYDADGQCDPNEIPQFINMIQEDRADLVLASRFVKPGLVQYDYPFLNRFGTIVLSKILSAFTGINHTDSHGGIRAMKPEVVEELEMLGTHTYVQETIIDAHEKGFRIIELPSAWLKRQHGKSRVVSSIPTYIFHTLPILILRSKQHLKWLYTLGIVFFLSSFIYFGIIFYQSGFNLPPLINRVPALILVSLLVTTGIQFFFFGFILQLLKVIKYRVDKAVFHSERSQK